MVVSQNFPCIVVMQNDLYTTDVHLGVWERRSDLSFFFLPCDWRLIGTACWNQNFDHDQLYGLVIGFIYSIYYYIVFIA